MAQKSYPGLANTLECHVYLELARLPWYGIKKLPWFGEYPELAQIPCCGNGTLIWHKVTPVWHGYPNMAYTLVCRGYPVLAISYPDMATSQSYPFMANTRVWHGYLDMARVTPLWHVPWYGKVTWEWHKVTWIWQVTASYPVMAYTLKWQRYPAVAQSYPDLAN